MLSGRVVEHAGLGLATPAVVSIDVTTNLNIINGNRRPHQFVHLVDGLAALPAGGPVKLIGYDNDQIAGGAEAFNRLGNARQDDEIGERDRRVGAPVADLVLINNAAAVEKNGGFARKSGDSINPSSAVR